RLIYFFFQAEDGIRDLIVTGVQTCALPISKRADHTAVFPLEETAHRSRKSQDTSASMTKNQHFHITFKGGTITTMILTIHSTIHSHPALKEPVNYIAGRTKSAAH